MPYWDWKLLLEAAEAAEPWAETSLDIAEDAPEVCDAPATPLPEELPLVPCGLDDPDREEPFPEAPRAVEPLGVSIATRDPLGPPDLPAPTPAADADAVPDLAPELPDLPVAALPADDRCARDPAVPEALPLLPAIAVALRATAAFPLVPAADDDPLLLPVAPLAPIPDDSPEDEPAAPCAAPIAADAVCVALPEPLDDPCDPSDGDSAPTFA